MRAWRRLADSDDRDLVLFLAAAAVSNAGNWMQLIAVQALLFELTERGSWLGLYTVATLLPGMFLAPYAGVLADHVSRRKILVATQIVQIASAAGLCALYLGDAASPRTVVAIGTINGVANGVQTSAWQSFMPSLVAPDRVARAVRWNSVQYTVARLAGPSAGAVAVALGGITAAIAANGVSFGFVLLVLAIVRPRDAPRSAARGRVLASLREGLGYVRSRPALRIAVLLAFLSAALGQSLQYVASAVADGLYGRAGSSNAALLVPFGIGALCSSVLMLSAGRRWRGSIQIIVALGLLAAGLALSIATRHFLVGQIAYAVVGAAQVQTSVCLNTVLQHGAIDSFRGRVLSLYLLGLLAGIPAGSQALGLLGDRYGYRPTLAVDVLAVTAVLVWVCRRQRWRLFDTTADDAARDRGATLRPAVT